MTHPLFVRYDQGSGDPIVLLHGINGDGTQWEKIMPLLTPHYRVIVVDVLGHGKSPRPAGAGYTPREHADALRAALENCQATQNLTVVGYSMGGAVALSYAALYPDDVVQLYLISTPYYLTADQMIANRYAASMLVIKSSQLMYRMLERMLAHNDRVAPVLRYLDASDMYRHMIGASENMLDADVLRLNIRTMVREFDFVGMLKKVKAPVTYFAGKKDPFVVQGQLYALRKYSPYMAIQRLGIIKMDHMLVQNLPKEIAAYLLAQTERTLHIEVDKGEGPVLVLLHGIESSSHYWGPITPALCERRRVIVIDLLGFGKSPKPDNIAYSLDEHIAWLHRTLQALNITKFALAGHSLGSIIALGYAAAYPDDIRELTLFSPVLLPKKSFSRKYVLHGLQRTEFLPDMSYMYAQAADVLGDARMVRYIPTVRSIENTINTLHWNDVAKRLQTVPTTAVYGLSDPLVDADVVEQFAHLLVKGRTVPLAGQAHNFPYFAPEHALETLDGLATHSHAPHKGSALPRSFLQQFVSLAVPAMAIKSLLFFALGGLLFTDFAPYVLTLAVVGYMLYNSYRTIQGAFSLKNEGLSYIAYFGLGLASLVAAIMLYQHPHDSLKIAALTLCLLFVAVGAARLFVALFWARAKHIRRMLVLTGAPMVVFGGLALAGSMRSVYIVVYCLAAYLIFQGIRYGSAAVGSFFMAYVRGHTYKLSKTP